MYSSLRIVNPYHNILSFPYRLNFSNLIPDVTIKFWLRTGHNRLRQHMYKRFKVGDSEICPCGQAPQNTEHVLQTCSSHRQIRSRTWPNHTPLEKKLYGTTEELALTVDYIVASGLTVWQTAAGRTKKKKKKNSRCKIRVWWKLPK